MSFCFVLFSCGVWFSGFSTGSFISVSFTIYFWQKISSIIVITKIISPVCEKWVLSNVSCPIESYRSLQLNTVGWRKLLKLWAIYAQQHYPGVFYCDSFQSPRRKCICLILGKWTCKWSTARATLILEDRMYPFAIGVLSFRTDLSFCIFIPGLFITLSNKCLVAFSMFC